MPDISEIVNVTITTTPKGVTRQGFGVPLILSPHIKRKARALVYENPDSMIEEDFDVTDPEYLMAQALFSQTRQPTSFIIGRQRADKIALNVATVADVGDVMTIRIDSATAGLFYGINIIGANPPNIYEAQEGDTVEDIAAGLVTAINGGPDAAAFTAADNGDGTFTLTSDVANTLFTIFLVRYVQVSPAVLHDDPEMSVTSDEFYFRFNEFVFASNSISTSTAANLAANFVSALNTALGASGVTAVDETGGVFSIEIDTTTATYIVCRDLSARMSLETAAFGRGALTAPGFYAALTEDASAALVEVQAENPDWFWILAMASDPDYIYDIAKNYAESRIKYFFGCTDQADILDTTESADTTSVAAKLKAESVKHTRVFVHDVTEQWPDAAIVGDIAPLTPGAYDTVYHTLVGVTSNDFTDTQRANALSKGVMLYTDFAGTGNTEEGENDVVEYTDVVVGNMFVDVNLEADIFDLMRDLAAQGKKLPYTDKGIGLVEAAIRARLRLAEGQGIYVAGSSEVSVPKRADTTSAQRQGRRLTNVTFTAQLQGAIRFVDVVGSVSV